MKWLLYLIAAFFLITTCIMFQSNGNTSPRESRIARTYETETTITYHHSNQETPHSDYRGDSITGRGNVTIYADYGLGKQHLGDDMYRKEETYLIRYVDDTAADTMVLRGPHNNILGDGNLCKIVAGVDTLAVDIRKPFPEYIDLRYAGVLPGCSYERLSRHYKPDETPFYNDFQLNIAMPEETPLAVRNFLSRIIRDEMTTYFVDHDEDETKRYYIPAINLRNRTIARMEEHYYRQFCKLYHKKFVEECDTDEYADASCYSFQLYAYPVWQNSDSTLTTWKFYTFGHAGGMHSSETEYFLTFDNSSGRILGSKDFFTARQFENAINTLTRQIKARNDRECDYDACILSDGSHIDSTYYETIGDKVYPRPALTPHGIVFSYHNYDKSSDNNGILHLIQPYRNDFKLK